MIIPQNAVWTLAHVTWVLIEWEGLRYEQASGTPIHLSTLNGPTSSAMHLLEAYWDHLKARNMMIKVPQHTPLLKTFGTLDEELNRVLQASGGRTCGLS